MKTSTTSRAVGMAGLLVCAHTVTGHAAGLDRSGQSVLSIFDESGTASISVLSVSPDVTGSDSVGTQYEVGESYTQTALTYTRQINDQFSFGLVIDQPYGADTFYNGDPTVAALAGTGANLSSEAVSLLAKYQITPRFSVFGGIKGEQVRATVNLNGTAYANAISVSAVAGATPGVDSATLGAALAGSPTAAAAIGAALPTLGAAVGAQVAQFNADNGYAFRMDDEPTLGYVIGAAYEIPDIALRLAVTYHFETDHTGSTTETILGNTVNSTVDYKTPASLNVQFQTGIAKDTLLTASYRWTDFSAVDVIPTGLGSDLVNLDDGERWTLGVARRFTDKFSGSVSLVYEPEGDDLVSPLGPTNGLWGISIGGQYTDGNMKLSGGINYSMLGDAQAEVGGVSQASFSDSSSLAIGFKAEFVF